VRDQLGGTVDQPDAEGVKRQWRTAADQLRPKVRKLAALMDGAEDVLAYMTFPATRRASYMKLEGISSVSDTGPARLSAVPA
jgi:transposase-like protein